MLQSIKTAISIDNSSFSSIAAKLKQVGPSFALTSVRGTKIFLSSKKKTLGKIEISYEKQLHIFEGFFFLAAQKLDKQIIRFEIADASQDTWQAFLGLLRKNQHIEICRSPVEASDAIGSGFDLFFLEPSGLFDLNLQDVDLSTNFLGRSWEIPFMITGMTGGVAKGAMINQRLAALASQKRIPMGVGSQRLALEQPDFEGIFKLKPLFPDLFLIGNLGFTQLAQSSKPSDLCQRAVDMIQADAMAIHFNGLQEMIQPEGNRSFKGALTALEKVCKSLKVPVLIKEVGAGFNQEDVKRLLNCGAYAVDIGGKGGTSWAYIEGLRSSDPATRRLGEVFRSWGYSTAQSLQSIRSAHPRAQLSATGGIRSPIQAAKALALGADMVGIGLPFFRAALTSKERLEEEWEFFSRGLHIAMMATGAMTLDELKTRIRTSNQ